MSSVCERREEMLINLLYEEGDPRELAETRAHLGKCSQCRQEYESITGSRELLSAWPNVANVPRLVYVSEPFSFMTRVRRWVDEMGSLGLRSMLRPAITAAAVMMIFVIAISVLRFAESEAARPVSREEFSRGMEEIAIYIDELVRNTRIQDQQLLMAALEQQLNDRDAAIAGSITGTVLTAVNEAFGQMDQYGQRLDYLTAAFQDLYDITGTELQKTNAILAALLQQGEAR